MIIYKPKGVVLPDEVINDFYYQNTGSMRLFVDNEIKSVTPHSAAFSEYNVVDHEFFLVISSSYPEIYLSPSLSYIQSGVMYDIGLNDEIGFLQRLSNIISVPGIEAILDLLMSSDDNGAWIKIKDGVITKSKSFIEVNGYWISGEIKKKISTPPPLPPYTARTVSQEKPTTSGKYMSSSIFGGIAFGEISPDRAKFIRENSIATSSAMFAMAIVKSSASIGSLQDFGLLSEDLILKCSHDGHTLMTPTPEQLCQFLHAYGTNDTIITVMRLDSNYRYSIKLDLSKKKSEFTLTPTQRRYIISYLVRRANITAHSNRSQFAEDLATLSDSDLAAQDGVEKSGYKDIYN